MANTVPDTENPEVAALAIAWEIVKVTRNVQNMLGNGETSEVTVANAVIKVYEAILNKEPIEKE